MRSLFAKLFKTYSFHRCNEICDYIVDNLSYNNEVSEKYNKVCKVYPLDRCLSKCVEFKHIRVKLAYQYDQDYFVRTDLPTSIWMKISSSCNEYTEVWNQYDGFVCKGNDNDPWKDVLYSEWKELVDLYYNLMKDVMIYDKNERKKIEEHWKRIDREICKEKLDKLNEVYK
jgi:hypothetical protein